MLRTCQLEKQLSPILKTRSHSKRPRLSIEVLKRLGAGVNGLQDIGGMLERSESMRNSS